MTDEELENWKSLWYRINEEGIDYTFNCYSNWNEIKDEYFHKLRNDYLNASKNMKKYISDVLKENVE